MTDIVGTGETVADTDIVMVPVSLDDVVADTDMELVCVGEGASDTPGLLVWLGETVTLNDEEVV